MDSPSDIDARLAALGVTDGDLVEKFIRGSGSGGQKINKTSSCIFLKHLPSGICVKCQLERSREMNRFHARRELCERLEAIQHAFRTHGLTKNIYIQQSDCQFVMHLNYALKSNILYFVDALLLILFREQTHFLSATIRR